MVCQPSVRASLFPSGREARCSDFSVGAASVAAGSVVAIAFSSFWASVRLWNARTASRTTTTRATAARMMGSLDCQNCFFRCYSPPEDSATGWAAEGLPLSVPAAGVLPLDGLLLDGLLRLLPLGRLLRLLLFCSAIGAEFHGFHDFFAAVVTIHVPLSFIF